MTTATGRPRTFDEDEVLARILGLFRKHGYEDTTLDQLVAASGLSKSSLYNAFGGKQALMDRAMGLYIESESEVLYDRLADEESGPEALETIIGAFGNPTGRGCADCLVRKTLIQNASSSEPPVQVSTLRRTVGKLWKSVTQAIGHIRGSRKSSSRLALSNEERAAVIVGLIQGTAVLARSGKQTELLQTIQSAAQKLVAT